MYLRRLPSGRWQATVRTPDGRRETHTATLKRSAEAWGRERETELARGVTRDPRRAKLTVREWSALWLAARVVEPETRRGDEGVLRNHVLPEWHSWQLAAITRLEVQRWVRELERGGTPAPTIRRAYMLLRSMLQAAVDDDRLEQNPAQRVSLPTVPVRPPVYFTRSEVERIIAHAREPHASLTALMAWTGLRWEEGAALHGRRVDWLRGRLDVVEVLTQGGRLREYPKTSSSRRTVPVPRDVLDRMARLLEGRDPEGLVFVTPRGGHPLSGSNYRTAWRGILEAAGVPYRPPHVLRHTAASWLVQDGVPLFHVSKLLGHSSLQTTMRYAHLAPDAHEVVESSWRRAQESN